jgi:hypothetical protein
LCVSDQVQLKNFVNQGAGRVKSEICGEGELMDRPVYNLIGLMVFTRSAQRFPLRLFLLVSASAFIIHVDAIVKAYDTRGCKANRFVQTTANLLFIINPTVKKPFRPH